MLSHSVSALNHQNLIIHGGPNITAILGLLDRYLCECNLGGCAFA
jgi:hypothetical protein